MRLKEGGGDTVSELIDLVKVLIYNHFLDFIVFIKVLHSIFQRWGRNFSKEFWEKVSFSCCNTLNCIEETKEFVIWLLTIFIYKNIRHYHYQALSRSFEWGRQGRKKMQPFVLYWSSWFFYLACGGVLGFCSTTL